MFLHTPPGLINAVFNRVTDAGKTFEIRRVKAKKVGSFVASITNEYLRSITVFLLLPLQTGSLQNNIASSRRDFFGSMIVNRISLSTPALA
jgi:hypothetical protein